MTLDIRNTFDSGMHCLRTRKEVLDYLLRIIMNNLDSLTILMAKGQGLQMTCGVLQGSILGLLLWNIYYDGVLKLEPPTGRELIEYANTSILN